MKEWNFKLIYPSHEAYLIELEAIKKEIKEFAKLKGTLGSEAGQKNLAKLSRSVEEKLNRAFCYVSMKYDLNQKDVKASVDYQTVYQVYSELISEIAFINPELISVGVTKVLKLIDDLKLTARRFEMVTLFRNQVHILDSKSEGIMANYNETTGALYDLYDKLAVSDNNSTKITISTGEELNINESNFTYYLGVLPNQEDRRLVFETIYKFYENHKNTFAGIYNGIMLSEMASVKHRGYDSILESHLYSNAIPLEVYHSLIKTAKNNSDVLKKYYALRKKYFKLEKLHTYDRFLQFSHSEKEYSYELSKKMVLEACEALGKDYYEHAKRALEDGRVSVETKDGKRTGAYSTSLYQEGSFILLNHNNNLDSAFTIAHEAGHSIHSLYSNENQPFETANYRIFVAEIASTFNEQLFLDYVMKHSSSKEEKIVVLQQAIDNIVATFYRQTLFADYEFKAHELVEKKVPVTASALSEIMVGLYKDYYGLDIKEEVYKHNVWAYIPHFFHSPFYVYQYATSFAASLAIYDKVKNNESEALENYIKMLSMGGSTYPIDIVKTAGVDLTKPDAFIAVAKRFEELLEELEELLK